MIRLVYWRDRAGSAPFTQWLSGLKDRTAKVQVTKRLARLMRGNFGDCSPVGEGVIELRVHVGAGYRVYCARHGQSVVLLLCGGDKHSQSRDIRQAQELWKLWKEGQKS